MEMEPSREDCLIVCGPGSPYNEKCTGSPQSEWHHGLCPLLVARTASTEGEGRPAVS